MDRQELEVERRALEAAGQSGGVIPSLSTRRISLTGFFTCLGLALATSATYLRVREYGFFSLDDGSYVVNNIHLREGFTARGINWAFTSFDPDNWFPLTRLSHMLDYALFGLTPGPHHVVNIVIHTLATVLLYAFLRRATGQRWPSAFVAAVFGVHPMHVESVAWVSERKDVLCAFFWFAALWAWVRYTQSPSVWRYVAALVLAAAGLMSKPMIVTLPLLLPVLDIWPLRRTFSRKSLVLQLPFWALSVAASALTVMAQKNAGYVRSLDAFPLSVRLENAALTVFAYIGKTFWPVSLINPYPWPREEPHGLAMLAGVGIAAISVWLFGMRRARPYLVAGWLWFLVTLIPVIGIVQVGPQAGADRYMYVPMVGLLAMVAWGGDEVLRRLREGWARPGSVQWLAPGAAAAAGGLCLLLASQAWSQEQYWGDAQTLFRHAIAEDEQNYLAWEYLGTVSDRDTQLDGRIECYRTAAQLRPDLPEMHSELGKALLYGDHVPEAVAAFEAALRLSPGDTKARCLLGGALLRGGRIAAATEQFQKAVSGQPDSPMAHNDLAIALLRGPNPDQKASVAEFRRAIALRPEDALFHANLGLVLLGSPDSAQDAVPEFIQALSLDPEDVPAHLGLAKAFSMPILQNPAGAAEHLATAQRLEPNPERIRKLEGLRLDYGRAH